MPAIRPTPLSATVDDPVVRESGLEGARGLAVALVVVTHASFMSGFTVSGGLLGRLAGRGDYGVALFFGLSGYLLYRQMLDAELSGRRLDIAGYLLRRGARVLPAYWLALTAVVVAVRPEPWTVVWHALAAQIYVPSAFIAAFSQSWSIPTEISFYLALPFAAILLRRVRHRAANLVPVLLVVVSLVSLAWLSTVGDSFPGETLVPDRLLPGAAPLFAVGMLLAECRRGDGPIARRLRDWATQPLNCWAIAAGLYLVAITPVTGSLLLVPGGGWQVMTRILLGCLVSLFILLPLSLTEAHVPNWPRELLGSRPMRLLGDLSYGVFLWHVPVFTGVYAVSGLPEFRGGLVALLVAGLPLTMALAWMSNRWIEKPAMRWASRRSARYVST
jgi:peptidoglycan/LPS O-acetylase OafA/YrhL